MNTNILKKISIIFPTYNGWQDTKECLLSIQKADYPKELFEIIVVDNHSSDGTPRRIKKLFPEVTVIELPSNMGFSKAINKGIAKSKGVYLIIGNNDVVYDKNYFKEMLSLANSDSRIGAIGGKAYYQNQPEKIAFGGFRVNPYLGYHLYDLSGLNKVRACDLTPPGGFLVRRSILQTVGLFDEDYFLYFEDLDFFLQIKRKDFKVLYNPRAIYYHGYGKTAFRGNLKALHEIIYYGYRSKWRCIIKNATPLQIFTSIIVQLLIIHLENIRSSIKTYKPFLRGVYWNLKHLKETLIARRKIYLKNSY